MLREPGGLKEPVVHIWTFKGQRLVPPIKPDELQCDDGDATVFRSYFPQDQLPRNPVGTWSCETYTVGGQLVGLRKFQVVAADPAASSTPTKPAPPKPEPPKPQAPGDAGVRDAR